MPTVTKGRFYCQNKNGHFFQSAVTNGTKLTVSGPSKQYFYYMNSYNGTTKKEISELYYYGKGV